MPKLAITRLALSQYVPDLPARCHLIVIPTPKPQQIIVVHKAKIFEDTTGAKKILESIDSFDKLDKANNLSVQTKFRYRPNLVLSSRHHDILEQTAKDIEKGHLPIVLINRDGAEIWKRLPGEKVSSAKQPGRIAFHIEKPIVKGTADQFQVLEKTTFIREVVFADPPAPGLVDVMEAPV